jgi:N-acetylneuraminic acid mutarotase
MEKHRSIFGRVVPVVVVAVAVLGLAGAAHGASIWTEEGPLRSPRVSLAATAGREGTIFAIGGQEVISNRLSSVVEVYRPSARQWVDGPALPGPRADHAAATGGDGRIYAIGGLGPDGFIASVVALKPGMGAAWAEVAPLPTPRRSLGAAAGTDGRIYVVGGLVTSPFTVLDVLEIYDPAADQWRTGAPMPTPRFRMGVARGGDGRIYAIGGNDAEGQPRRLVEVYSPLTNSWTTAVPLPSLRSNFSVTTSLEGLIYAIGGCEWKPDGSCLGSRRVDVYSPDQNKWFTTSPTISVHGFGAAATGRRRIFVIGGDRAVESRPSFCFACE